MNRCKAFLESLKPGASAAALIHRPENIRWLTGYTGEGCAFIGMDAQVIITDFRYTEQAGRQAPECACLRTEAGLPERAHVKALCDAVEEAMDAAGEPMLNREGHRSGTWVLLDFGFLVVHVFTDDTRKFYDLERLWSDADEVQIGE